MDEKIDEILKNMQNKLTMEGEKRVFGEGRELTSDDLIKRQPPEDFTLENLIDKILFEIFQVNHTAPTTFRSDDGTSRTIDRAIEKNGRRIFLEAKPINADLEKPSQNGAKNQVIGAFRLHKVVENYHLGIATDGLTWIFVNSERDPFAKLHIETDLHKIKAYITNEKPIPKHKRDEISKRFYEKYNDILHGTKEISEEMCFVNSIKNVELEEDREEIAQLTINRLLFIKFLYERGFIKSFRKDWDFFNYLKKQDTDVINAKLKQLFFEIMNKPSEERVYFSVDSHFYNLPFLNGSLFEKNDVELKNPDYTIDARILRYSIDFLDRFKFSYLEDLKENQSVLDPEILGYIFEKAMNASDRKGTGAYYTPKSITEYMAKNTIYPLIFEKTKRYLIEKEGYNNDQLRKLKSINDVIKLPTITLDNVLNDVIFKIQICDPACGSGAFLLATAQVLFEFIMKIIVKINLKLDFKYVGLEPEIKCKIINSLYGVDINSRAIEIARLRIWLWLVESYLPEFIQPLPNLDCNICTGNSLIGFLKIDQFRRNHITTDLLEGSEENIGELLNEYETIKEKYKFSSGVEAKKLKSNFQLIKKPVKKKLDKFFYQLLKTKKVNIDSDRFDQLKVFHWGLEFDEIFSFDKSTSLRGFDIIIGNPPYLSNWQLSKTDRDMVEYLDKKYTDVTIGHWDIYILFIKKALDLLDDNGFLSFIVPSSFSKEKYGKKLRELIINEYSIITLVEFNTEAVFKDVARQYIIFIIQKKKPVNSTVNVVYFKNLKFEESHTIPQKHFIKFHNFTFRTDVNESQLNILEKISSTRCLIGNICCVNVGVVAHSKKGSELKFKKNGVIHEYDKGGFKRYIEGRNISRYSYSWNNKFLDYDSKSIYFHRPKFPKLFENDKIIIRRVSGENNSIISVFDNDKFYTNDNLINIISWDESILKLQLPEKKWEVFKPYGYFSLKYILGVLNSKLITFYFSKMIATGTLQGTYSGVYPEDVRIIPIQKVTNSIQKPVIVLVDKILKLNKKLNNIDDKKIDEKLVIQEEIEKIDSQIDKLVYELYGLTNEEISIVEESLKK